MVIIHAVSDGARRLNNKFTLNLSTTATSRAPPTKRELEQQGALVQEAGYKQTIKNRQGGADCVAEGKPSK